MEFETPQAELSRLNKQLSRMRHDKIFGGLTNQEQDLFDQMQVRIYELRRQVLGGAEGFGATVPEG